MLRRIKNWFATFNKTEVKLWLDDIRPAPRGWYWATTALEAEDILSCFVVTDCSLDHDLGNCESCLMQHMATGCDRDCRCTCHETGYDLVKFMLKTNTWPRKKPTVHSSNPVGRKNIQDVLDKFYNNR